MKLTRNDLFAHDIGLIVKCDDWEKTGDQILKWKEDAEDHKELLKNHNRLLEIVERLKKEESEIDPSNTIWSPSALEVKRLLQKILEGRTNAIL